MSAYNGFPRLPKLSSTQLYALALIAKSARDNPPNISKLSKQLSVDLATMSAATNRMAADGYICQTRRGSSIYLSLTHKGAEQLELLAEMLKHE